MIVQILRSHFPCKVISQLKVMRHHIDQSEVVLFGDYLGLRLPQVPTSNG